MRLLFAEFFFEFYVPASFSTFPTCPRFVKFSLLLHAFCMHGFFFQFLPC